MSENDSDSDGASFFNRSKRRIPRGVVELNAADLARAAKKSPPPVRKSTADGTDAEGGQYSDDGSDVSYDKETGSPKKRRKRQKRTEGPRVSSWVIQGGAILIDSDDEQDAPKPEVVDLDDEDESKSPSKGRKARRRSVEVTPPPELSAASELFRTLLIQSPLWFKY